ncbi:PKD domain-containing protein [Massilia endophytica]|uniref:PKD domain-containing protein n=1 Tax=Massilia endophytica TaxID=2899220 RepID=UPI001E541E9D|nr:PKD domain-containing protein [Massilia endophytica]UGQ47481.1 PKD domain-containing protein [Massilia endophytica]
MKTKLIARALLLALSSTACLLPAAGHAANAKPVPVVHWEQFPGEPIIVFGGADSTDPDGHVVGYSWKFGDGASGTGQDTSHMYAKPGKYTVTFTAKDDKGATASKSFTVTVAGKPNVAPTAKGTVTVTPNSFTAAFNATGSSDPDGRIASYAWNFGDGTSGTGLKASHVYKTAGSYTAVLTVKDNEGATNTLELPLAVTGPAPNKPPVAAATATQQAGKLTVSFNATASSDPDGKVASYAWNFGNGKTGAGATPSHTYAAAGSYNVTLTVKDNKGATGSLSLPVTVNPPAANKPPVAAASANQSGKLTVSFDASASKDTDGSIASYAWNFGDGKTGAGMKVSHVYAAAGQYQATLTVKDNKGASASLPLTVTVTAGSTAATPWVSGYYAGWFWNDYQPQHIDMSAMTHVVFGRVAPGGGTLGGTPGQIVPGAGTAHDAGQLPASVTSLSVEDFLVQRAHGAGIKALLMLGGNDDGAGFSASTKPGVRTTFINNLVTYLATHDYDGVDVDWEDHIETADDQNQLIAFITELKQAASIHNRYRDRPLIVTFPTSILNMNYDVVPGWKVQVAELVDQFNIMSYEIAFAHGGWTTWHFSPLFGQSGTHPSDVSSSVQAYIDAGIVPGKIGIGLGFYALSFTPPVTGPNQTVSQMESNDATWSYANLVNGGFLSAGTYVWDDVAQVGYRSYPGGFTGHAEYNTGTTGFLSYEDPRSIAVKGKWVREKQLGGAIIWTINYGSPDGLNNPLLNAVKQSFLMGADSVQPYARFTSAMPSTTELRFNFDASQSADAEDKPVASYSWNFGDGATATGVNASHVYASAGRYLVTLTVTDAKGVSASTTSSVLADFPPPPDELPPLEPVPAANGPRPWVTAYYAGWFWNLFEPQYVDMSAMSHYVFGRVAPGGGTLGGQPGEVVPGAGTAHQPGILGSLTNKSVEDYLVQRAHESGVKALLMIGGMGDGLGFLRSTTSLTRPVFVKNLLDYLEAHDYDGIDLDWEDVLDTDQAKLQLTALIANLRAGAKERARWQDPSKPFVITFPNYAMNMNYETVPQWKVTVASIVDQFNLMSYALGFNADGWTSTTFSPIEGKTPTHPMDVSSSIQAYQDAGIDRKKLGVGIGFYGMSYAPPVTAPNQPATAMNNSDTSLSYAQLVNEGYLSNGSYHWDDVAKMGYRSYSGANGFKGAGMLSYEDEASIAAKGKWVRNTGTGGAIIWTINYGSPDGKANPLMNAAKKAFLQ